MIGVGIGQVSVNILIGLVGSSSDGETERTLRLLAGGLGGLFLGTLIFFSHANRMSERQPGYGVTVWLGDARLHAVLDPVSLGTLNTAVREAKAGGINRALQHGQRTFFASDVTLIETWEEVAGHASSAPPEREAKPPQPESSPL